MAINDIEFKKNDNDEYEEVGHVTIKIDNATETLPIKELVKKPTHFDINVNDTAVKNDIHIQATLYEGSFEDSGDVIKKGTAWVNITTEDHLTILYSTQIEINDNIDVIIPNNFVAGTYNVNLIYNGNKYYNSSNNYKSFKINKRPITCDFNQSEYFVKAGSKKIITGTVKDIGNGQPIVNAVINYKFNEKVNQVTTDNEGMVTFELDIPEQNQTTCIDNKNKTYMLLLSMETNSFILERTSLPITIIKEATTIDFKGRNNSISGDILTDTDFAKYGTVKIIALDGAYEETADVDEFGQFSHDINIISIINNINSNVPEDRVYDISSKKRTTLDLTLLNSSIYVGESFTVRAQVKDVEKKNVTYGTVDFRLINQTTNKTVYRYITELDMGGAADFIFYTSKIGTYKVEAYYSSIVEYEESNKRINNIKVEEKPTEEDEDGV